MQLGLFSISYGGLWGQAALDLRAFTRRAADLGFEAVMLAGKRPHLAPLDMTEDAIGALQDELKTARVQCPIVAAYTDLTPHSAAEVPFLEMQIAYVESLCRIGQAARRQHRSGFHGVFLRQRSSPRGLAASGHGTPRDVRPRNHLE